MLKKLTAYIAILALIISFVPGKGLIARADVSQPNLIENGDFENGTVDPWEGRHGAKVSLTNEEARTGSYSLKVTDREGTISGPMQEITGKLIPGASYEVSVWVKYTTGPETKPFNIAINYGPGIYDNVKVVAEGQVVTKGEWGLLKNTFTALEESEGTDYTNVRLFIETPFSHPADPENDLMDFYIDDVSLVLVSQPPGATPEDPEPGPEPDPDKEPVPNIPDNLIENAHFEEGTEDPWAGREGAVISLTNEDAKTGDYSLKVTDRKHTYSGPMQEITGKLIPGASYEVSAWVKYTTGPETKPFNIAINYGPGLHDNVKLALSGQEVTRGEWSLLKNTFTAPDEADGADYTNVRLFIETPFSHPADPENDLMDFYIDDVSLVLVSLPPDDNLIENGGFETGELDPWVGRDNATITVTTEERRTGDYSVKVTNRTQGSSGPEQYITDKVLPGGMYEVSAWVKYNTGPDRKQFIISIHYGTGYDIRNVTEYIWVDRGEWGELKAAYTIPLDASMSSVRIFIETPWKQSYDPFEDLMDFYVDDVSLKLIAPPGGDSDNLFINGDFESRTETPWTGRNNAKLIVTDEEFHSGRYSLKITNREVGASGPDQDVTGKLKHGGEYKVSAWVKYNTGPDRKQFIISINYGTGYDIRNLTEYIWVDRGEWGLVDGSFTVPEDADLSRIRIFIETPWKQSYDPFEDLMDFYVDDLSLIVISEPKPEDPYIPPPLPSDGMAGYEIETDDGSVIRGSIGVYLINNQSVIRLTLDKHQLDNALANIEPGSTMRMSFTSESDADVVVASLPMGGIQRMIEQDLTLELVTELGSYILPLHLLDQEKLRGLFDENININELNLDIRIGMPAAAAMEQIERTLSDHQLDVFGSPIEYTISVRHGQETVEWTDTFASYAERTIDIPEDVDPAQITTAVVVSPNGTVHPVPTSIVHDGDRTYARINSLSNSVYVLVGSSSELKVGHMNWAEGAAADLGSRLVLKESGTPFDLSTHVTRGEFASMIVRALGLSATDGSPSIIKAMEYGLITRFVDGSYRLDEAITREEAAVMVSIAIKQTGLDQHVGSEPAVNTLESYIDASEISNWAVPHIVTLIKSGVLQGQSNELMRPKHLLTNAEAVTMLYRLLVNHDLI